ncbi:MAG: hypothetical protein R3287_16280 [Anderseniella sp.]|nr:hypothetical protein [Anderseniella sp.]
MRSMLVLATAFAATMAASPAIADDDDDMKRTRSSQNVPELMLGKEGDQFHVNQKDFTLLSGQGYRWKISAAGELEYKFKTDLWRDAWMNQIVISDLEIHMAGAPAWLEFDDEGTIQVQFNTVRPGTYKWWVEGLEDRGMTGTITVK